MLLNRMVRLQSSNKWHLILLTIPNAWIYFVHLPSTKTRALNFLPSLMVAVQSPLLVLPFISYHLLGLGSVLCPASSLCTFRIGWPPNLMNLNIIYVPIIPQFLFPTFSLNSTYIVNSLLNIFNRFPTQTLIHPPKHTLVTSFPNPLHDNSILPVSQGEKKKKKWSYAWLLSFSPHYQTNRKYCWCHSLLQNQTISLPSPGTLLIWAKLF